MDFGSAKRTTEQHFSPDRELALHVGKKADEPSRSIPASSGWDGNALERGLGAASSCERRF
jgi:hypothetical protein